MSEPRRHHVIPQMYLRRFANADGCIAVVSRDGKKRFETGIAAVAAENGFYDMETAEGRSTAVEGVLSRIEGGAAKAIDSILGGTFPPSAEERDALAWFIAFQWLRGWDMREGVHTLHAWFRKSHAMNLTRRQIREGLEATQGRAPTDEEVESMAAFLSDPSKYDMVPANNNTSVEHMMRMAPGVRNLAMARQWYLLRFSDNVLVTGDAPVTLASVDDRRKGRFGAVGFGTADHVRLPLDRRHALVLILDGKPPERVIDVPASKAQELVFRTAAAGHKWVFHHPADAPLVGMELPPPAARIQISGSPSRLVPDGL